MIRTVRLGQTPVGPEHPPLFLPEIGLYFGKDVGRAKASIQEVIDAGFKVIKGEICHSAEYVLDDDFMYHYRTFDGMKSIRYREFIESLVLPMDVWYQLYGMIHDAGLTSVISAYDRKGIDFIKDAGGGCIKIASNNVVNIPLIKYAARKGLPLMMDTGKARLSEIALAIETMRDSGCDDIILNHSPDGHPAPAAAHNLRVIETYEGAFGLPVGIADHYQGDVMVYAAAAMGYSLIEKPCVPDPHKAGIDATWTMPLADMVQVREKMCECWIARGASHRPQSAGPEVHPARMGLVTARAVKAGERVNEDSVTGAWPCRGISVGDWRVAEGATFNIDLGPYEPIRWEHVQPRSKP